MRVTVERECSRCAERESVTLEADWPHELPGAFYTMPEGWDTIAALTSSWTLCAECLGELAAWLRPPAEPELGDGLAEAFARARLDGCTCEPFTGAHRAPCPWAMLTHERGGEPE